MPLIKITSIWTPLALIGIRLLKDDEGHFYLKLWGSDLKKIR